MDLPAAITSRLRKACDACHARKVRCDKQVPCAHCVQLKIPCLRKARKSRERRSRAAEATQVLEDAISHTPSTGLCLLRYRQDRLDQIDNRLDELSSTVEFMQTLVHKCDSELNGNQTQLNENSLAQNSNDEPGLSFIEGDSSLAAHSTFASEVASVAIQGGALPESSILQLRETLDSLHQILSVMKQRNNLPVEVAYIYPKFLRCAAREGSQLPPFQQVAQVILDPKPTRLAGSCWIFEYLPVRGFSDMCLGVYFSEDYSFTDFITVNATLYSLLMDEAFSKTGDRRDQILEYARKCKKNLETALANLPLHLPATSETIVALLFGAYHGIEIAKPMLSWSLTSKAAEICITLGYHRSSILSHGDDRDAHYKQLLFWSVYFIDKSLTLRLGRPSNIPDWEVTVPLPSAKDFQYNAVLGYFRLWLLIARCQGSIYEDLYSPDALSQPDGVRNARIQSLVSRLNENELEALGTNVHETWYKSTKKPEDETLLRFFALNDEVLRLSLLTLVYRAARPTTTSPPTFYNECLQTARAALAKHHECIDLMEESKDILFPTYMNWTLLFAPFTPFFILFCHVIETLDKSDLGRLQSFLTSLNPAMNMSDTGGKAYRLFQLFCSVAVRYVELHTMNSIHPQIQDKAELDTCLDAMGISRLDSGTSNGVPHHDQAEPSPVLSEQIPQHHNLVFPIASVMEIGNGVDVENWFTGNQQILDLLQDEDIEFI